MFKKLLLSFFLVLTVFMSFAPTLSPVLADDTNSTWYNQDPKDWFLKVYDPTNGSEIFGERYTAAQVQWIFYSILFIPITTTNPKLYTCMFSGDVKTCVQSVITQTNSNQSPVAQSTNKNIVQLIFQDRPFSGITYSKNVLRKFSIIPEANAQTTGFGFTALDPILSLWRGSRNIAYVLLILVTIVMAFLIMFRVKISPQVVISVQSALPKVVVAIILITFSYAIAGFLIDLMYVVIGIVSLLFTNYLGMSSGQIFNLMTTGQPTGLPVSVGVFGLVFLYLGGFTLAFISVFLSAVGGVGTSILGGAAVGVTLLTGGLVPILILLIFLIAFILLIIHIIRIVWMLVRAFANILLLTIFAPFQILAGTLIPSFGFTAWLKSFISNLAVFVVVGVLFLLSFVFLNQAIILSLRAFFGGSVVDVAAHFLFGTVVSNSIANTSANWPPLLGWGTDEGTAFLMLGASFVVFTLIPRSADVIQGYISGRPFAFGSAIGEAVVAPISTAISGGSFIAKNAGAIQEFRNANRREGGPAGLTEAQVTERTNQRLGRFVERNRTENSR